jgi:hypothetical protein
MVQSLELIPQSDANAASSYMSKGIQSGSQGASLLNNNHLQVSFSCDDGILAGMQEKQPLSFNGFETSSSQKMMEWVEDWLYERCTGTSSTMTPLECIWFGHSKLVSTSLKYTPNIVCFFNNSSSSLGFEYRRKIGLLKQY